MAVEVAEAAGHIIMSFGSSSTHCNSSSSVKGGGFFCALSRSVGRLLLLHFEWVFAFSFFLPFMDDDDECCYSNACPPTSVCSMSVVCVPSSHTHNMSFTYG